MAFTYMWEVTGVKTKDQLNHEGVTLPSSVCQTYWKLTGTNENGEEGSFSGATPFCADHCCAADFCEFGELTEVMVLSWIQNIVANDSTYKSHIDQQIQKMIDIDTISEPAMPWANPEDAEIVEEPPAE
tara:strand:- start:374 stop:760 length:387 start_codon:yes stop_codon:yes gene_type:complete